MTADEVWSALAEIPDPEIPVVSLVDLGVVKGVEIDNGTVRVDFTPTFMGCPALEVMQRAMQRDAFCSYCGAAFTQTETYPRVCAACEMETWANPNRRTAAVWLVRCIARGSI